MRDALIYLSFIGVFMAVISGFEVYRSHALKPPPSMETSLEPAQW